MVGDGGGSPGVLGRAAKSNSAEPVSGFICRREWRRAPGNKGLYVKDGQSARPQPQGAGVFRRVLGYRKNPPTLRWRPRNGLQVGGGCAHPVLSHPARPFVARSCLNDPPARLEGKTPQELAARKVHPTPNGGQIRATRLGATGRSWLERAWRGGGEW